MASPYLVHAVGSLGDASVDGSIGVLHDGSLLILNNNDTSGTGVLYQLKTPAGTPTVTALSQTFSTVQADFAGDLLCVPVPGSNSTDIWVAYGSNFGVSGDGIVVAHATYNGSTFTWDNTGTALPGPVDQDFQETVICWTGTWLIVGYRDNSGGWGSWINWTSTKNGSSGWSSNININSTANSGSHTNPLTLHHGLLAGGSAGASICIYPIDSASGHSEQFACRVLLDSAASPALANWKAEVKNTNVTGQNTSVATYCAAVHPTTGVLYLVYTSSAAGTGGVAGTSVMPITVTSAGVASFGARTTIDTANSSGGQGVACVFDQRGRLHVLFSTGTAGGASGVCMYSNADAPYTSWSAAATTVANTAGDCLPHTIRGDQVVASGFLPWYFERNGTLQTLYDNTIAAGVFAPSLQVKLAAVARAGQMVG